jgi:Cdc6-like AAA superfamily ATPase
MFNLNKVGRPVALIQGDNPEWNKKIVSLHDEKDEDDVDKQFSRLMLPDNLKFQLIPDTTKERTIGYLTGASGSGKSTFTRLYCEQWRKKYKDGDIYLFSNLKEDESLDNPITMPDLANSLVIFDDVDCIKNKAHREAVVKIMNEVLEVGRHSHGGDRGISCIITNHLPTDRTFTRRVLNEAHWCVYFPHSGIGRQTTYMLENYLGMSKDLITKIRRMKTRWCCVFRNYPMFYMTERYISLISEDDESS